MNRCLAFLAALLFASLSVASACTASPAEWVSFTLQPDRDSGEIHATFRDNDRRPRDSNWSTSFPTSQLVGFDTVGFRASGNRPLRFAIVREAGRLDCTGQAGNSFASGQCSFTPDANFTQLLASRGIERPTRDEAFGLMAVDARREVVDAVAAARYPTPEIDDLMALAALGVTGDYIRGMAQAGYRPASIDSLVQFKALDITPGYVAGFARVGYANVDADELVQLKALDITPAFIAGFQRIGYPRLSVDTLVQLKALDITPEFVVAAERERGAVPTVPELIHRRMYLGER